MTKAFQYFCIPFENLPAGQPPPYAVWFASWSTTPPILEPGMTAPIVIGCTDSELPAGAVALGTGSKDPPPPPPLLATTDLSAYQASISQWLETSRSADE